MRDPWSLHLLDRGGQLGLDTYGGDAAEEESCSSIPQRIWQPILAAGVDCGDDLPVYVGSDGLYFTGGSLL